MPTPVIYVGFVIDASRSMTETDYKPSRLEAALRAVAAFIRRLRQEHPNSNIAIVCFSREACTLCGWLPVAGLRDADVAVSAWRDACLSFGMGNTAIGEGLKAARLLAVGCPGPARVVLLTDGHQNDGVDPRDVAGSLKKVAALDIVGIGGSPSDVDEELLTQLASRDSTGSPRYRWIDDEQSLTIHFEELAGRITRD